jgi:hypothetical protein
MFAAFGQPVAVADIEVFNIYIFFYGAFLWHPKMPARHPSNAPFSPSPFHCLGIAGRIRFATSAYCIIGM